MAHFRNVVVKNSKTPLVNDVVPDPSSKLQHGITYYFHDHFEKGLTTKVVSVKYPDLMKDGDYKTLDGFTGNNARAIQVKDVEFPTLLDPVDDLPPATLITSVRLNGGKVHVRGVSHDNGFLEGVTVNGAKATILSATAGVVDWEITIDQPRQRCTGSKGPRQGRQRRENRARAEAAFERGTPMNTCYSVGAVVAGLLLTPGLFAAENDPRGIEFFENKIRPVLVKSCYECHSATASKVRAGLLLDTRDGIRKGGESGPAVVPGNVDGSLLLKAIRHEDLKMPPKEKLSAAVIADFVQWVKMGAPDPRTGKPAAAYKTLTLEEARSFWSFKPPVAAQPPKVQNSQWPRSDIDRFILARLEEKGLRPVADAERPVLVRRLYFDLIGLPPSPEELAAALADTATELAGEAGRTGCCNRLTSASAGAGTGWTSPALPSPTARKTTSPFRTPGVTAIMSLPPSTRTSPTTASSRNRSPATCCRSRQLPPQRDEALIATGFLALTSKPRAQNNPDYDMDLIADQIDVTTRGFLGLTVQCARCHDHKFDPVPTREYYALAGIFQSSWMLAGGATKGNGKRDPRDRVLQGAGLHELSDGGQAMGVKEATPTEARICRGGDSEDLGDPVPRGFLTAASPRPAPSINPKQSGRLELAQWLSSPDNPLTARVAVNRVWHHLFGRGLVPSLDDFGTQGERPSHPELLDHLAVQFMADGWSVKRLIKTIVLSRTYQLASAHDPAGYEKDPDNVFLWRMNRRRLEAEAIRDTLLAVSGQLERTPPGASTMAVEGKAKRATVQETNYRSVYHAMPRGSAGEVFMLFDGADPNLIVARRNVTTVPAQALYLMNNTFMSEQARRFAQRLGATGLDDAGRVDLAYRLAFARSPSQAEQETALAFIRDYPKPAQRNGTFDPWVGFCRAILSAAELRYLE